MPRRNDSGRPAFRPAPLREHRLQPGVDDLDRRIRHALAAGTEPAAIVEELVTVITTASRYGANAADDLRAAIARRVHELAGEPGLGPASAS